MKKQNKGKILSFSELSNCCGEEMKIVGGDEGTMFYQCLGCSRGCDPMIPKKLSSVRKPKPYSFDEVEKLLDKAYRSGYAAGWYRRKRGKPTAMFDEHLIKRK